VSAAARRRLADGRWHFQHGPIDCILSAEGEAGAAAGCVEHAWTRFRSVLEELVGELPLLRANLGAPAGARVAPAGTIARRMIEACRPHASGGRFITAMAAVAGSVAEELIASFIDPRIVRAYVNNGGDIALHLSPGTSFQVGLVADPVRGLAGLPLDGRMTIEAGSRVRGIATSGWRGRSFSLGIADAATVLAESASAADAAATLIGNAVDVADPRIVRRPASEIRDDSDLGDLPVTCAVPALPPCAVEVALAAGARAARAEIARGRMIAAVLSLQGRCVVVEGNHEARVAAPTPRLEPVPRSLARC
jgi:uncharacterized protein